MAVTVTKTEKYLMFPPKDYHSSYPYWGGGGGAAAGRVTVVQAVRGTGLHLWLLTVLHLVTGSVAHVVLGIWK